MRKGLLAAPIAAATILAMAGTATAQDCFVVNRSFQGAISAGAHSQKWVTFTLKDILMSTDEGGPGLCEAQADAVVAAVDAAGLPTAFATRNDKVLLEGTGAERNGLTADGKGIDHFENSPIIGEIFDIVAQVAPTVSCV